MAKAKRAKPKSSKRPKYSERVGRVREAARKISNAGKPFAAPITSAQVNRILGVIGKSDPYGKGGPLEALTVAEATHAAKNGGRNTGTASVGAWKRSKAALAADVTLDPRRVTTICVAAAKIK
jgi:hypothetical protein